MMLYGEAMKKAYLTEQVSDPAHPENGQKTGISRSRLALLKVNAIRFAGNLVESSPLGPVVAIESW